jgi:hypothetical protein
MQGTCKIRKQLFDKQKLNVRNLYRRRWEHSIKTGQLEESHKFTNLANVAWVDVRTEFVLGNVKVYMSLYA